MTNKKEISNPWHVLGLTVLMVVGKQGEAGIAILNLERPVLYLNQLSDNHQFESTIKTLQVLNVDDGILFPHSHCESSPFVQVMHAWHYYPRQVARSQFSEDRGMDMLRALSVEILDTREMESWYLARAAAAALLRVVESEYELKFAKRSLRINLGDSLAGRISIDAVTIYNLEILCNRRSVLLDGGQKIKDGSLLDLIDDTVTKGGARKLRSELSGPPCEIDVITRRQTVSVVFVAFSSHPWPQHDAKKVVFFLTCHHFFSKKLVHSWAQSTDLLESLREALSRCHDVDSLVTHYSVRPKTYTMITLKREADNALRLREVLRLVPTIEQILSEHHEESPLAQQLRTTLKKAHVDIGNLSEVSGWALFQL